MAYRVFSGPKGAADVSPSNKEHMLFKEVNSVDEALGWARHLARNDRVALLIEGDDGTYLNRRDIGAALGAGQGAQIV